MAYERLKIAPSTAIARMDYDAQEKTLIIEWVDGRRDLYEDVPEQVSIDAQAAPSIGRFVNAVIRPNFRTH